jgi:hypothetical protein
MPFRFLQDHLSDVEQRVGAATRTDLPRQRLDPLFVGDQADVKLRKGRRRFTAFARRLTAGGRAIAALSTVTGRTPAFALRSERTPPIPPWAAFIPASSSWRALTSRGPGTTPVIPAVRSFRLALIMGVFRCRRLLRPSGQEEFVQIQFVIR